MKPSGIATLCCTINMFAIRLIAYSQEKLFSVVVRYNSFQLSSLFFTSI